MKVQTHTEKIAKLRKFVLELLLTNHPLDCPVCEAAGDCRCRTTRTSIWSTWCRGAGVRRRSRARATIRTSPTTAPAASCAAAACASAGKSCPSAAGATSTAATTAKSIRPYRLPLQEVGCVSCGQCVSTCPVGAIVGQRTPQGARAWQTTKTATTCSYCADGCRLLVHSFRDQVVRVSSEEEKGLNGGNLCVKGRFALGYADAADRLTAPQVARPGRARRLPGMRPSRPRPTRSTPCAREHGGQAVAAVVRDQRHQRGRLPGAEAHAHRGRLEQRRLHRPCRSGRRREGLDRGPGHRCRHQLALRSGGSRRHPGAGRQPHRLRPGARADRRPGAAQEQAGHRGRPAAAPTWPARPSITWLSSRAPTWPSCGP